MRMCVVYCRSRATRLAQRRSAADGERSAMADTGAESNEKYMEGNNGQTSFPARHCASALGLLAMAPRPSVRPSQVGVLSKRPNGSRSFLVWWLTSAYPTLCWKGILVCQKIKSTSLWNQNSELGEKFRNCTSIVASVVNFGGRSML